MKEAALELILLYRQIAKATEEFRQAGLRMAKFVSGTGVAYMSSVLVQEAGADRLSPAKGLKVGSVSRHGTGLTVVED